MAYCLNRMLCRCYQHLFWLSVVRLIVMKKLLVIAMVLVLAVTAMVTYNKTDALSMYNQLPGSTTWKVQEGVVCPDGSYGFRLVSSKGQDSYWQGNPSDWDINLTTGEVVR